MTPEMNEVLRQAVDTVAPLVNSVVFFGVAIGIALCVVLIRLKDVMPDESEKPKRLSDDGGETFMLGDDGELLPVKHKNR